MFGCVFLCFECSIFHDKFLPYCLNICNRETNIKQYSYCLDKSVSQTHDCKCIVLKLVYSLSYCQLILGDWVFVLFPSKLGESFGVNWIFGHMILSSFHSLF